MAFRFTDVPPTEQLRSDAVTLNQIKADSIVPFVDVIFSFLEKLDTEILLSNIQELAKKESIGISVLKSSARGLITISFLAVLIFYLSHITLLFLTLFYIIRGSLVHQSSDKDLLSDLSKLGVEEKISSVIVSKWQKQKSTIGSVAVINTLKVNQLIDMQWRFGLTSSNSEVSKTRDTFLQMKLTLDMGNAIKEIRLGIYSNLLDISLAHI